MMHLPADWPTRKMSALHIPSRYDRSSEEAYKSTRRISSRASWVGRKNRTPGYFVCQLHHRVRLTAGSSPFTVALFAHSSNSYVISLRLESDQRIAAYQYQADAGT